MTENEIKAINEFAKYLEDGRNSRKDWANMAVWSMATPYQVLAQGFISNPISREQLIEENDNLKQELKEIREGMKTLHEVIAKKNDLIKCYQTALI